MRLPKINQKVSIRITTGPWAGRYSTYVEGLDQRVMTVAHPMYGGSNVPLPVGEEVLVEFMDGKDRLVFPTRVLGHDTQVVPILSLALPAPGEVRRHQQRDFVRLDANIPISYALLSDEKSDEAGETAKAFLRGRTMDISGSGAQIVTQEAYPVGTKLELILHLEGTDLILEAEVVRLAGQPNPREVWLGVRYTRVDERDREKIVRFIFSEQRLRRQKGLL